MDYHSLKYKELQALCKKHGIPANSARSVLADKLSELLNEKHKPTTRKRTCIKSFVENSDEGEPAAAKKEAKKVRFNPDNDLVEYDLQPEAPKKQAGKVTRSKAQATQKGGGEQSEDNKQSKKVVKDDEKASEPVKEAVVGRARVTRSKAQIKEAGTAPDADARGKKKRGKEVEADGQNDELDTETIDIPMRATRSRKETVKEDTAPAVAKSQVDNKRTTRQIKATDVSSNLSHADAVDKQERPQRKSSRTKGVETVEGDEGNKVEVVKGGRATRFKAPLVMEASAPVDKQEPLKRKSSRTRGLETVEGDEGEKLDVVKGGRATRSKASLVMEASAPVDKQDPLKRKSSRNRGVETVEGDEGEKVDVVKGARATRSKAPLVREASGRNGKNKAVKDEIQQVEEIPKNLAKKNVNRRKSVLQPEKVEADLPFEEPVNHQVGKNTRRKSVMPKATKKVKPSVTGKEQSKAQSGKEATSGSLKSRKRKETPTTEDPSSETEYRSHVKSPKSSARSTGKSAGKSAKKQTESILKESSTTIAKTRGSTSKKRAKLSEKKQSISEDHAVGSITEGTPIVKMRNLKPDEAIEPEVTPALDKSIKRHARSTIKSERKEPGQSAIKESAAGTPLFSPKVGKFTLDPAVNTAPGRITRTGIKHGGDAAGSFSEKIGKRKQASKSARKKQPLDDAQMAAPKSAEVAPDLDDGTAGVKSAIKQPLDESHTSTAAVREVQPNPDTDTVGISGLEAVMLPINVAEENRNSTSEPSIDMEIASNVNGENSSGEVKEDTGASTEKSTYEESGKQQDPKEAHISDDETPLGENFSHAESPSVSMKDVVGTVPDPVSGGSHLPDQSEEVYVESRTFSESVNLETPVLQSGRPDAKEKEIELMKSGFSLKGLQTDGMVEDSLVSVGKSDCEEEGITAIEGHESNPDAHDASVVGEDDLSKATMQSEPISEPSADDIFEAPLPSKPLMGEGNIPNDSIIASKELETGATQSNANEIFEVPKEDDVGCDDPQPEAISEPSAADIIETPLSGKPLMGEADVPDDSINVSIELETGLEQSNANKSFEVGCDDPEPAQNESMPVLAEVLASSGDQEPEQTSNVGADDVPFDSVREEEASTVLYTKEADSSQPVGDIDAHESHTTNESLHVTFEKDESPVEGSDVDLSTIKEDDRPMQEEIQSAGTSVDWGDYNFDMDVFEKPDSANINADLVNEGKNDDQESDFQTSFTSSIIEESSGLAAGLDDSVRKLEKDSKDVTAGKSNQVDAVKESAIAATDMTEEAFSWSDSSKKSLWETPATTRPSDVRDKREDTVNLAQDTGAVSSMKSLFTTPGAARTDSSQKSLLTKPPATQSSHAKDTLEDAPGSAYQGPDLSLKTLLTTPGTTQTSQVMDAHDHESATMSANQDQYSALKRIFKTPAGIHFSHTKVGQEKSVKFADQDPDSSVKLSVTTPATVQISHVKVVREDATVSASQDLDSSLKQMFATPATTQNRVMDSQEGAGAYSSLKLMFTTPATTQTSVKDSQGGASAYSPLKPMFTTPATQISHAEDSREDATASANKGEIEGHAASDNEMFGVSFEDYPHEDTDTSFDFKGGHDDQIQQFEFSSEGAGTSHGDFSSLKDNSIHSRGLVKKEDLLTKGSETDEDLAFNTGDAGDTGYSNE